MKFARLYWNISAGLGVLIQLALFGAALATLSQGVLSTLQTLLNGVQ